MTPCHYNQHTSHTNICVIYQLTTHVLSQHTFQMTWHVACPILGQSNNILPRVGSTRYFLQCDRDIRDSRGIIMYLRYYITGII